MPLFHFLCKERLIDLKRVAHLLRGTAFDSKTQEMNEFANYTQIEARMHLLSGYGLPVSPGDLQTGLPWTNQGPEAASSEKCELSKMTIASWLANAREATRQMLHALIRCWHRHFMVARKRVRNGKNCTTRSACFNVTPSEVLISSLK
jgi:hypothetical protein